MTGRRTFTLEKLDDKAGLMTVEPAPEEPTVFDVDDFDGAFAQEAGTFHGARTVTLTLSPGAWNERESVEIEGMVSTLDGKPTRRLEHLELPATVEDETTIRGQVPFLFPPGVRLLFPTEPEGGTFTIGVGDAVAPAFAAFDDVRALEDGRVAVQFDDEHDDQIPLLRGERLGVPVVAIVAERTEVGVTLFFPPWAEALGVAARVGHEE